MNREKKYQMNMCEGSILPKLLIFALPLMISSMLQLLFNAADIIIVGNWGSEYSIAAVGSNTALINLMTNLFLGLSVGVNVLVARYFASKQEKELQDTIHTAILLSLISGFFLLLIGVVFAKQILILMNTPALVLPLATQYMRIYFLGMPAMMLYNFGSAILRAIGDTKRPLYFLSIAGVVNIVLNLFLVIALPLDVAGVGIATVVSQYISAGLILLCLCKEKGALTLSLKKLHLTGSIMLKILHIGLPAGFQGTLFALSNVAIQSSINSFGEIVLTGNAAAANIESFVYMGMNAFYQAAISFTGQNTGRGCYQRISKILLWSQVCVITTGIVMGGGALLFGTPLLRIYSHKPAVIQAGIHRLQVISATYALCGIMDVLVGVLRGMGYSIAPMIVSLIGVCGLRLLWLNTIFTMPKYHKIQTVYLSYPITWILTIFVHILTFMIAWHKINRSKKQIEIPKAL